MPIRWRCWLLPIAERTIVGCNKKGGTQLATFSSPIINSLSIQTDHATPADSNWRTENIDLSGLLNGGNATDVHFKFNYISALGGSINIDNVWVGMATAIAQIAKPDGVRVYPNPTADNVTVLSEANDLKEVDVVDVSGKTVLSLSPRDGNSGQSSIDTRVAATSAANTTLRHLATHTSGFPRLPQSFLEKMGDEGNPYKDLRTDDLYDYLKTCAGKKAEGSFEYSNFGMGLLGHILALKMGVNYEEAVQRELLRPLGMSHTFVTPDSSMAGNIAQGYNEAGAPTPVWTDTVLTGAGSFLSNASDMLLFIRANVDKAHPLHAVLAKTHLAQSIGEGGLGWMTTDALDKFMGNRGVLWHNGMAGGYFSYVAIDTAAETGIIVLSNKSADLSGDGSMLMRTVSTQSWKR